jgi:hypothetical protein
MQVMRVAGVMILQPEFLARHNNVRLDELVDILDICRFWLWHR